MPPGGQRIKNWHINYLILFDFNQNIGNIISNAFLIKYFTQSMHIGTCVMGTLRSGHSFNWAFVASGSCNPHASIGTNMTSQWRILFEPTDCPMFFKINKYGSQLNTKEPNTNQLIQYQNIAKSRVASALRAPCRTLGGPTLTLADLNPNNICMTPFQQ